MDCQQRTFLPLETIEEEADQTLRSHASDEDFLVPVEVEAEPAEAQSEEDDVGFRVMRARRKTSRHGSRSSGESRNSCPPLQMGLSQHEDTPVQCHDSHAGSGKKRARTHQKSTSRTLRKSATLKRAPFPKWLVDLMVNIEEAKTHQLVVE